MTNTSDAIAAYLARGGKINRIASDERALTEREIWLARRGTPAADPTEERRIAAVDHLGRSIVVNGLGEFIGYA